MVVARNDGCDGSSATTAASGDASFPSLQFFFFFFSSSFFSPLFFPLQPSLLYHPFLFSIFILKKILFFGHFGLNIEFWSEILDFAENAPKSKPKYLMSHFVLAGWLEWSFFSHFSRNETKMIIMQLCPPMKVDFGSIRIEKVVLHARI